MFPQFNARTHNQVDFSSMAIWVVVKKMKFQSWLLTIKFKFCKINEFVMHMLFLQKHSAVQPRGSWPGE